MKSLALSQFENVNLISFGLLIFFVYFCGVLWWVSRRSHQQVYQELQNQPFEDGE